MLLFALGGCFLAFLQHPATPRCTYISIRGYVLNRAAHSFYGTGRAALSAFCIWRQGFGVLLQGCGGDSHVGAIQITQ
eukprot:1145746-Pelagomonas_calceolata.AAC.1